MSEINSALGRLQMANGPQAARPAVLNVSDESGYVPPQNTGYVPPLAGQAFEASVNPYAGAAGFDTEISEQEMEQLAQVRREQRANAAKITAVARERLEILTGLNRLKSAVEVEGVTFALRSLKSVEMREIMISAAGAKSAQERYFATRDAVLAKSIFAIDGQDIALVLGTKQPAAMFSLLASMEHSVVERIFEHYEEMIRDNRKKVQILNKEDGHQVSEDIKKL